MTRVDLTKAQCAELVNYLRSVLNNGMGAGSFDKLEMLVLARRALAAAEELVERCARYAEEIAVLRERVRPYEDTGLTADVCAEYRKFEDEVVASGKTFGRLPELLRADTGGRVVVLPVKPVLTPIISSMLYIIEDGDIYEDALYEAVVGMSENGKMNVVYTTLSDQIIFEQADIGKTVFLTREEAKKALEAMRKGKLT